MTIDRRPIFTVGMVWTDFVKRLPRTYTRFKGDPQNPPDFGLQQAGLAQMSAAQMSSMQAQMLASAQAQYGPLRSAFGPWPPPRSPYSWPFGDY